MGTGRRGAGRRRLRALDGRDRSGRCAAARRAGAVRAQGLERRGPAHVRARSRVERRRRRDRPRAVRQQPARGGADGAERPPGRADAGRGRGRVAAHAARSDPGAPLGPRRVRREARAGPRPGPRDRRMGRGRVRREGADVSRAAGHGEARPDARSPGPIRREPLGEHGRDEPGPRAGPGRPGRGEARRRDPGDAGAARRRHGRLPGRSGVHGSAHADDGAGRLPPPAHRLHGPVRR